VSRRAAKPVNPSEKTANMTDRRRPVKGLGENSLGVADHRLTLTLLPATFAACRLDPKEAVPAWATSETFLLLMREGDLGRAVRPVLPYHS
jgi:hypothetical protein